MTGIFIKDKNGKVHGNLTLHLDVSINDCDTLDECRTKLLTQVDKVLQEEEKRIREAYKDRKDVKVEVINKVEALNLTFKVSNTNKDIIKQETPGLFSRLGTSISNLVS